MRTFADILNETSGLSVAFGETENKKLICLSLQNTLHTLIAGSSGTGKSVFLHTLLLTLISHNSPEMVRFILYDSKYVELGIYNEIPHLLCPATSDSQKLLGIIQWLECEMKKRLQLFSNVGKKTLGGYNDDTWENRWDDKELPCIVVVIDDLTLALDKTPELEAALSNILLKGRIVGIYLFASMQTPTWKSIKRLVPLFKTKLVFDLFSLAESKLLIGRSGAQLQGECGEAFLVTEGIPPTKVHTIMVNDEDIFDALSIAKKNPPQYEESIIYRIEQHTIEKEKDPQEPDNPEPKAADNKYDELLPAAIEVVLGMGQVSVSMLQRRLKLGYSRASHMVDQMEAKGIIGPFEGSKPRQILITKEQWQKIQRLQKQ